MRLLLLILMLLFTVATPARAMESAPPMAPDWTVSEWLNGEGSTLADLKGKVVVIEFFQMWCPGCNSFSIPLMHQWQTETFKGAVEAGALQVVSIHTVFEGHSVQTPAKLRKFIKRKGITNLVGIDAYEKGDHYPITMRRWKTGGTPEVAIVDKKGRLRFQEFGGFNTDTAEALIKKLLKE
ncbi:TlpA disulfide reductase family protein [Magnetospira sp. QH-2]|uniref:TlpA family protein disulfide reductase n=1 Tax=Magnetospira sp. (strain QH-2) TaxID=1288970 RepID=UPI0003E81272|nr:TlpA disulfide reductase family protein [Magnetospira sp. QH-2]CCQ73754.1 Putative thiol-disulfide isomerase and thioredoxins [Magnetospira sp. QH-2]